MILVFKNINPKNEGIINPNVNNKLFLKSNIILSFFIDKILPSNKPENNNEIEKGIIANSFFITKNPRIIPIIL